jgi:hypothetical protein
MPPTSAAACSATSRNPGPGITPGTQCPVCGQQLPSCDRRHGGRTPRHCPGACKARAYRARQQASEPAGHGRATAPGTRAARGLPAPPNAASADYRAHDARHHHHRDRHEMRHASPRHKAKRLRPRPCSTTQLLRIARHESLRAVPEGQRDSQRLLPPARAGGEPGIGIAVHLVQDGGRGDEIVRGSQVDTACLVQAFEVPGGELDVEAPQVVV